MPAQECHLFGAQWLSVIAKKSKKKTSFVSSLPHIQEAQTLLTLKTTRTNSSVAKAGARAAGGTGGGGPTAASGGGPCAQGAGGHPHFFGSPARGRGVTRREHARVTFKGKPLRGAPPARGSSAPKGPEKGAMISFGKSLRFNLGFTVTVYNKWKHLF